MSATKSPRSPAIDVSGTERIPILRTWIHASSVVLALLALATILFGSAVTSMNAGDTDPTWDPRNAWTWLRSADSGLWYELRHRVFATLFGLVGLIQVLLLAKAEPRRALRLFGYAAFAFIVLQGTFGGVRVLAANHEGFQVWLEARGITPDLMRFGLAIMHGVSAQLLLAAYIWLTLRTSKAQRVDDFRVYASPRAASSRRWLGMACLLLVLQIALGAWLRHDRELGIMVWIHLGVAILATVQILAAGALVKQRHPEARSLWSLTGLAGTLLIVQLFLGFLAWVFVLEQQQATGLGLGVLVRAAHQINGAALLSVSVAAWLRARLVLRGCPETEGALEGEVREAVL